MARIASGRESRSSVSGVCGSIPVCLVTSVAGGGESRVVVVGVAGGAGDGGVRAGEGECRVVVIERGRAPGARRMADGAVGGEAGGDVVGIRSSREVRLVA